MANTADAATIAPSFPVKEFLDPEQLRKDLAYTPTNLTDAFMQQASLFSHYGVLASQASRQVDVIKLMLENTEAAVYQLLRNQAAAAGDKVTEVQLEKAVTRHERVISTKQSLNEAKRIESACKTAVEAFRHRRDMLIQHGLVAREEMKGELYMKGKSQAESVYEETKNRFAERYRSASGDTN